MMGEIGVMSVKSYLYPILILTTMVTVGCSGDGILPAGAEYKKADSKNVSAKKSKTTGWSQTGIASFYGPEWHGRLTANGERLDIHAMTAAHKRLPFGTRVKVTNLSSGKSVVVRINDRGPFVRGRIIDLTDGAARRIGITPRSGLARVRVEKLENRN